MTSTPYEIRPTGRHYLSVLRAPGKGEEAPYVYWERTTQLQTRMKRECYLRHGSKISAIKSELEAFEARGEGESDQAMLCAATLHKAVDELGMEELAVSIDGIGGTMALHSSALDEVDWPGLDGTTECIRRRIQILERFDYVDLEKVQAQLNLAIKGGKDGLTEEERGN